MKSLRSCLFGFLLYVCTVLLLENLLLTSREVERMQSRINSANSRSKLPGETERKHPSTSLSRSPQWDFETTRKTANAKQNAKLFIKKLQEDSHLFQSKLRTDIPLKRNEDDLVNLNGIPEAWAPKARSQEVEFYQRRREKVNPYIYDIILKPTHPCSDDTFLVILVHSHLFNTMQRSAIRNTWGSIGSAKGSGSWPEVSELGHRIRLMFMIGTSDTDALNNLVQFEGWRFDDVVLGNFHDSYQNMTLKSLLGLKFVSEHCASAKYLLKSDDDMFINIPYLVEILAGKQLSRAIMGPLNIGSTVMRSGKWKLSLEEFPFPYFPPYESGAAYVITCDIVRELYETAEYVPHIFIDDVYITGILGRILDVSHKRQKGFAHGSSPIPSVCDIIRRRVITATRMAPFQLENIWHQMLEKPYCVN